MRRRATKIYDAYSLNANGETVTKDLPSDYNVTALAITMSGANVTDEATLAELLAGMGTIEISTRNGTPISYDADDLFYLNRMIYGHNPYVTKTTGSGADNDIRRITLMVPLNPKGAWDPTMGITPQAGGKVRQVIGTDTAAGADARTLTMTALGIEGGNPQTFMGAYMDSFTAGLGDNFREVQSDRVMEMMGLLLFATTGPEDLTSTDALGAKEVGWAVARSVREKIHAHVLQNLYDSVEWTLNSGTAAPISDYALLDLGVTKGEGLPYVKDLQGYVNAGVAEAMRLYPLLKIRNQ